MFRLQRSGLPMDPTFPSDLEGLGYFINAEDEIRSIQHPNEYFNFFLTKNERYNDVQRQAMNEVTSAIVMERLHAEGLSTIRLPLGASATSPHVPILASNDLPNRPCVIILFYEHLQELGILAQRVLTGPGGINAGSAVNLVRAIQALGSTPSADDAPGIILANLGQLRWHRRSMRALSQRSWYALPWDTAVSGAPRFDPLKNTVPGNRHTTEHVQSVFNLVATFVHPDAKVSVIAVSDGACAVTDFLDKRVNWAMWESRLEALALLAPIHRGSEITNPNFKAWLRKRGRAYLVSALPANTPIIGPDGNKSKEGFGCTAYSIGEESYTEMMLVKGHGTVLQWFQEVERNPDYVNEEVVIPEDENAPEPKVGGREFGRGRHPLWE